jgi:hypothetical protein
VRMRPAIVEALKELGDSAARPDLLATFSTERYLHLREPEARTLIRLGATKELFAPLARFAGMPEPLESALPLALEARALDGSSSAKVLGAAAVETRARLRSPANDARLWVATSESTTALRAEVDGHTLNMVRAAPGIFRADLPSIQPVEVQVTVRTSDGEGALRALWLVPRVDDFPPPPPRPWDAGPGPDESVGGPGPLARDAAAGDADIDQSAQRK